MGDDPVCLEMREVKSNFLYLRIACAEDRGAGSNGRGCRAGLGSTVSAPADLLPLASSMACLMCSIRSSKPDRAASPRATSTISAF